MYQFIKFSLHRGIRRTVCKSPFFFMVHIPHMCFIPWRWNTHCTVNIAPKYFMRFQPSAYFIRLSTVSTHFLRVLVLSRAEPVEIFSYSSKLFSCMKATHTKTFVLMYETSLSLDASSPLCFMQIRRGRGTSKHNCLCILFIRLTTCFGHCGPSSGHKNI